MPNRAVIIGVGNQSGEFVVRLAEEFATSPYKHKHGLIGVGIYDRFAGDERLTRIRKLIGKLGRYVIDLTRKPGGEADEIKELKELCNRVTQLRPDIVFLIADAVFLRDIDHASLFQSLQRESKATMFVLCFTNAKPEEQPAYTQLETYMNREDANNPCIFNTVFIVRSESPLAKATGGGNQARQIELVAKSLAAMWVGPSDRGYRPSLGEQVDMLREPNHKPPRTFIEMAISSSGITATKKSGLLNGLLYPIQRRSSGSITVDEAQKHIVQLIDETVNNKPLPMTTARPLPTDEQRLKSTPFVVNIIAPFKNTDPRYNPISDRVGQELERQGYSVKGQSMVYGVGIDLTESGIEYFNDRKGSFHCQICVLFAISKEEISGYEPLA